MGLSPRPRAQESQNSVNQSGEVVLHPRTSHKVIVRGQERVQHRLCREAFLHYFIYLFIKTHFFLSICH